MALVNRQPGAQRKNRHEKRDGVAGGFDWRQKVVVRGAGFLGQAVVKRCRRVVRRSLSPQQGLHLRKSAAIRRILKPLSRTSSFTSPLWSEGSGQPRESGCFLQSIMGVELIEQARRFGVEKLVAIGTICAYRSSPRPSKKRISGSGTEKPTPRMACQRCSGAVAVHRQQYGFNRFISARQSLRPG